MDANLFQIILGLAVEIIALVLFVVFSRVHAFPALIIAAIIAGTIGGYGFLPTLDAIKKGFGGTLGSIGIIIGFGVIMGTLFEISGAAKRMAMFFLKIFGKGREEYALAVTGFVVSIPIFCDSAFIILSSLAKAIARNTGKSLTTLGVALAAGLVVTHTIVPPTPGPLLVLSNFDIEIGTFLIWSLLFSIPIVLVSVLYSQYIGKKVFRLPALQGDGFIDARYSEDVQKKAFITDTEKLPSTFMSFLPIMLPLFLIFLSTLFNALGLKANSEAPLYQFIHSLGNPIVAVGLGLLVGLFTLTRGIEKRKVLHASDEAIKQAGIIVFVTGGGGALGQVLRDSGAGQIIAEALVNTNIPIVLLPIIIASLVRFLQGSGTVSLITSSSIVAPIILSGDIPISPVIAALGCCVGGLFFAYFNDSYFWVVTRSIGIKETKDQMRVWTSTTMVAWAVGVLILLPLSLFVR